jgi:adenosine deaminase CECR1
MIEKNICLEVCPISSRLQGYVNDLRNHPVRYFLHRGLQISLSSGYPGIFGYEDTALDYMTAFLSWDLSIRDLK